MSDLDRLMHQVAGDSWRPYPDVPVRVRRDLDHEDRVVQALAIKHHAPVVSVTPLPHGGARVLLTGGWPASVTYLLDENGDPR
jgi:hypothetical protein